MGDKPPTSQDAASIDRDSEDRMTDNIRSSRSMPLPDHLQGHGGDGLRHQDSLEEEDDCDLPPPSYEQAIAAPDFVVVPDTTVDSSTVPEEGATDGPATDEDSALSPEEISLVLKMQANRDQYLPDRRGSYEEAIEMIQPEPEPVPADDNVDSAKPGDESQVSFTNVDTAQPEIRSVARMEFAETPHEAQTRRRQEYTCYSCGHLNEPITRVVRYLNRQPTEKLILIGVLVFCILGLLLFVSLFPASFVYIEYHQVALPKSKMTGSVDRETVYYPGCYVLGPDTTLVRFQASAHVIAEEIGVFTTDTISITMRFSLIYFLRQKEVGQLYSQFMHDYNDVFVLIAKSTIKNLAGTSITVDQFRFNRTSVEKEMHTMLRKRLGGECCPECCETRNCQSNTYCGICVKEASCHPGYHIDVRYFSLLSVTIPDSVFERYLRFTILEIEKEKEYFLQDHAIIEKETSLLTQRLENEAEEITEKGSAESQKVLHIAEAEKEKTVQMSYATALQNFFMALKVSRQDYKQSLMLIRALEDSIDNIYVGYGYNESILYDSPASSWSWSLS